MNGNLSPSKASTNCRDASVKKFTRLVDFRGQRAKKTDQLLSHSQRLQSRVFFRPPHRLVQIQKPTKNLSVTARSRIMPYRAATNNLWKSSPHRDLLHFDFSHQALFLPPGQFPASVPRRETKTILRCSGTGLLVGHPFIRSANAVDDRTQLRPCPAGRHR